jgi:hypothetical protein
MTVPSTWISQSDMAGSVSGSVSSPLAVRSLPTSPRAFRTRTSATAVPASRLTESGYPTDAAVTCPPRDTVRCLVRSAPTATREGRQAAAARTAGPNLLRRWKAKKIEAADGVGLDPVLPT